MCGIVGYYSRRGRALEEPALKTGVAALARRGPDGQGFYFSENVGLGHSRLAIIDLTTGDQPIFNEDGSIALIVNGEFYNYREINKSLKQAGHTFKTNSDSESLVHLYEDEPIEKALNALNGMWALALWDQNKDRLILARDRVGKKPLYYFQDSDRLIFASEIKALKAFEGVDLEISQTALSLYLKYGYVPTPYSIYKSIFKFPAASYGIYENGQLNIKTYWEPPKEKEPFKKESDYLEEMAALIDDAVRLRLVSDVDLGVFLSGGIDSSLIVRDMTRHFDGKVRSFCIGFDDPSYDESAHAESAARYLDTELTVDKVDLGDLKGLPEIASYFDEPFADASFLPTWHLCQATRKHVTVALSGDGGDELFGGYRRYLAGKISGAYLKLPGIVRSGLVEPIVNLLPAPAQYYGNSWSKKAKLFVNAANRFQANPHAVAPRMFDDSDLARLFPGLEITDDDDPVLAAARNNSANSMVENMLQTDFKTYLADDILVKVDRMSMFHSLEVRCPFLDHRLVELAFRMPIAMKIKGFQSKVPLRKMAKNGLPSAIHKRSKQGFMVPLDAWFRGQLNTFIHDIIDESSAPWSKQPALNLLDEHMKGRNDNALKLWTLAVLSLWKKGPSFNISKPV